MKIFKHYVVISIILIFLSAIMFILHYLIFGQAVNTAYYSLMNLCFIPINSLIVTLILENLIEYKAKQDRLEKLNMLVGIFFTEVGSQLLHQIVLCDKRASNLVTTFDDLDKVKKQLVDYDYKIEINESNLNTMKVLLVSNSSLFINLISNENIHQHEVFTDLLMSVVHLRDEIIFWENDKYNELDITHLEYDIIRVYKNITIVWIYYLEYLSKAYPFLYNNAIRVNPFRLG